MLRRAACGQRGRRQRRQLHAVRDRAGEWLRRLCRRPRLAPRMPLMDARARSAARRRRRYALGRRAQRERRGEPNGLPAAAATARTRRPAAAAGEHPSTRRLSPAGCGARGARTAREPTDVPARATGAGLLRSGRRHGAAESGGGRRARGSRSRLVRRAAGALLLRDAAVALHASRAVRRAGAARAGCRRAEALPCATRARHPRRAQRVEHLRRVRCLGLRVRRPAPRRLRPHPCGMWPEHRRHGHSGA